MPFKRGHSPKSMANKLDKILTQELPNDIRAGLFGMYTVLATTADGYVPVDTSALVQSRTHRIRRDGSQWRLTYGYYQEYAKYLHEGENWKPKQPGTPGKKTGGHNPNARPDWLTIAWQESGDEARRVFAKIIEPK